MSSVLESFRADLDPPAEMVACLASRAAQLEMLPGAAMEAMRLAKDPDCSLAEYALVIERDVKLATEILKITNSAAYAPLVPIVSLHRAVLQLGLRHCQNLVMSASITGLMNRITLDQEWIRNVLWQHSFRTALCAMHLNNLFRFGFHGEEFTAGLVHDFGRTLLAVAECERFTAFDTLDFEEAPKQLAKERMMVGTDHCRLGAWYAIHQRLPAPLVEVMMWHHEPERADEHSRLTSLIAVADHMANHLQRFGEPADYDPLSNPFLPMLARYADARFEAGFVENVSPLMEKACKDTDAMLSF